MTRPSILFINRVYPPARGASGRMLRDLAEKFAAEGWAVRVLTTGQSHSISHENGVEILRLKGPAKPHFGVTYLWLWCKFLFHALRLPKSEIVVTLTDPPFLFFVGDILARRAGLAHMHWCHDLYPDLLAHVGLPLPAPIQNFIQRASERALARAERVVAIGRCMARRLTQAGHDARRISLIPNWPDAELARPRPPAAYPSVPDMDLPGLDEILNGYRAADLQIKHGPKFRVLYAGTIGMAHPLDTILEAARLLNDEFPEIEFVFIGDGPRHEMLAKEREIRHLENIRLIPYQPADRLKDLMESGDIHLISMKSEVAGMLVPSKLYGAMAAQRPCIFIGPEDCECAAVLAEFKAGATVPQGRPDLLAAHIRQMRLESDIWFAAHNGAVQAGQIFMPEKAMQAWVDRARQVLKTKRGR